MSRLLTEEAFGCHDETSDKEFYKALDPSSTCIG
jgi:hypothetical protein